MIVAAPRDIGEPVVNDSRHNVSVFLEHRGRIDLKYCTSVESGQILNGVEIEGTTALELKVKRVHNLWFICHKVMDPTCGVKRRITNSA